MKAARWLWTAWILVAAATGAEAGAQQVYWIGDPDPGVPPGRMLFRANLDGTNLESLDNVQLASPYSLAVAAGHTKAYWGDTDIEFISRASIDETGCAAPFTTPTSEFDNPAPLAIDVGGGRLYWAAIQPFPPPPNGSRWVIRRSSLDGGDAETIVTVVPLGNIADGMLDSTARKFYWSQAEDGAYAVRRANLDGSEAETLVDAQSVLVGGASAIDFDAQSGRLYWSDDNHIYRRGVSGGLIEIVVPQRADWLRIDLANAHLYWVTAMSHIVRRSTLDGTDIDDLFTIPGDIQDLEFVFDGIVTLPAECSGSRDADFDGDIDLLDFRAFQDCFTGPR